MAGHSGPVALCPGPRAQADITYQAAVHVPLYRHMLNVTNLVITYVGSGLYCNLFEYILLILVINMQDVMLSICIVILCYQYAQSLQIFSGLEGRVKVKYNSATLFLHVFLPNLHNGTLGQPRYVRLATVRQVSNGTLGQRRYVRLATVCKVSDGTLGQ